MSDAMTTRALSMSAIVDRFIVSLFATHWMSRSVTRLLPKWRPMRRSLIQIPILWIILITMASIIITQTTNQKPNRSPMSSYLWRIAFFPKTSCQSLLRCRMVSNTVTKLTSESLAANWSRRRAYFSAYLKWRWPPDRSSSNGTTTASHLSDTRWKSLPWPASHSHPRSKKRPEGYETSSTCSTTWSKCGSRGL